LLKEATINYGEINVKRIISIAIALTALALSIVGCQSSPVVNSNVSSSANNSNASNTAQSAASPAPTVSPAVSTAPPIDTFKAWQEAINKGDFEAYKKTISDFEVYRDTEGDVEAYKKSYTAFMSSVTAEHFAELRSDRGTFAGAKNFFPMPFKIRAQHIEGDSAEYEVRDFRGEYHCIKLLNMYGEWKLDKFYSLQLCPEAR
jgi:hypothetical protein